MWRNFIAYLLINVCARKFPSRCVGGVISYINSDVIHWLWDFSKAYSNSDTCRNKFTNLFCDT